MRVLVTGGAGFIGSHLVERLVEAGAGVTVLDDLSTGDPANLARVGARAALEVGSVLDGERLGALARRADRVVHLAAVVGVDRVAAEPERSYSVIVGGTKNAIAAARAAGVPLLVASSSEVYGFAPRTPVAEADLPAAIAGPAPRLAYARAKLEADRLVGAAFAAGQPALAVRPFNVVGPRQSREGGAVLPTFVARALAGLTLEVHGDGGQRRTFVDVRDFAELLLALVARESFPFAALNAGGREEIAIGDLARRVRDRLQSRSPIRCVAPPAARGAVEVQRRVPELDRLATLFPLCFGRSVDDAIDALAAERAEPAVA